MAAFMDVHDGFVRVTAEQLNEAHFADLAIEAEEGVHFENAWWIQRPARSSACRPGRARRP